MQRKPNSNVSLAMHIVYTHNQGIEILCRNFSLWIIRKQTVQWCAPQLQSILSWCLFTILRCPASPNPSVYCLPINWPIPLSLRWSIFSRVLLFLLLMLPFSPTAISGGGRSLTCLKSFAIGPYKCLPGAATSVGTIQFPLRVFWWYTWNVFPFPWEID